MGLRSRELRIIKNIIIGDLFYKAILMCFILRNSTRDNLCL